MPVKVVEAVPAPTRRHVDDVTLFWLTVPTFLLMAVLIAVTGGVSNHVVKDPRPYFIADMALAAATLALLFTFFSATQESSIPSKREFWLRTLIAWLAGMAGAAVAVAVFMHFAS